MTVDDDCLPALISLADEERARAFPKFFQAFPGGYGEGDKFIGVSVPNIRKTAKTFKAIALPDLHQLLNHEFHEMRQLALYILVDRMEKAKKDPLAQDAIVELYRQNLARVNNWDLVDMSAHKILGPYFDRHGTGDLIEYAKSPNLWIQRIAMITTFYFIRKGEFEPTLQIAEILLHHPHDLIHKAVGWMLREVGNRSLEVEEQFLLPVYKTMPRTMLRYAIEKFDQEKRMNYLKGHV